MFYMFYLIQIKIIGIVTLFFYIVVILPSLHLYPYIIYDFNTENPKNMWGMYANIYMKDEKIITILAMATAISSLGMLLGSLVDNPKLKFNNFLQDKNNMSSLPPRIWVFWVFLGILITSLTSYQDTLLSATYTQSTINLQDYNVSAAWFIAFSIAIFAYCDQIYDQNIIRKKIKKKLIIFTLSNYFLFWFI